MVIFVFRWGCRLLQASILPSAPSRGAEVDAVVGADRRARVASNDSHEDLDGGAPRHRGDERAVFSRSECDCPAKRAIESDTGWNFERGVELTLRAIKWTTA